MSLHAKNLNLVPVLRALLREKNVSNVAKSLGTTQPAVSGALARLRESLDDAILIRVGRGMELTPYAQQLLPQLEQVCEALENLWTKPLFDPQHGKRMFRIASPDYGPLLIGSPMINALRRTAPDVSMVFSNMAAASVRALQSGKIDFLLSSRGWLDRFGAPELQTLTLFTDEFVAVVAQDHPLARIDSPSAADYEAELYIIFDPDFEASHGNADGSHREDVLLHRQGLTGCEKLVARVKQFGVLPLMAAQTGCVALAPRRIVQANLPFLPVRILDRAFPATRFEVCLSWSAIHAFDPAHRWFRNLIQSTLGEAG